VTEKGKIFFLGEKKRPSERKVGVKTFRTKDPKGEQQKGSGPGLKKGAVEGRYSCGGEKGAETARKLMEKSTVLGTEKRGPSKGGGD